MDIIVEQDSKYSISKKKIQNNIYKERTV